MTSSAAALYLRRSSRKDLGENRSLREQEAECRALADRLGLEVVDVYEEREGTGASARSRKRRPEWERALAALDDGARFQTLIVWALDRADRRGADVLAGLLAKHAATGRRILGVDGTDTSDERQRLATIIRGEIAREEAESIAKRVARTKRTRRADGLLPARRAAQRQADAARDLRPVPRSGARPGVRGGEGLPPPPSARPRSGIGVPCARRSEGREKSL